MKSAIRYTFILVVYSTTTTSLVNPLLVFKDAYYETQAKRNELVKKELMKESKGPDLKFIGQVAIVGSFICLVGALKSNDIEFKKRNKICDWFIGSVIGGTIGILIEKYRKSPLNSNENYTFDDNFTIFVATFFNRQLLAKKLFNL